MSETLWAVIVGGLLGGGFSTAVLTVEHFRWKKEFGLRYLQAERERREKQCRRIQDDFLKGLGEGVWSAELLSLCYIRLPRKVIQSIEEAWNRIEHSEREGKQALYNEVLIILSQYLAEIDTEIEKLSGIAIG